MRTRKNNNENDVREKQRHNFFKLLQPVKVVQWIYLFALRLSVSYSLLYSVR